VWEILLLVKKGRLGLDRDPERWIHDALGNSGLKEATLNHEIAIRSRTVDLSHPDPRTVSWPLPRRSTI
jgi:PIN domain nuclease of toxin-antitoxin system